MEKDNLFRVIVCSDKGFKFIYESEEFEDLVLSKDDRYNRNIDKALRKLYGGKYIGESLDDENVYVFSISLRKDTLFALILELKKWNIEISNALDSDKVEIKSTDFPSDMCSKDIITHINEKFEGHLMKFTVTNSITLSSQMIVSYKVQNVRIGDIAVVTLKDQRRLFIVYEVWGNNLKTKDVALMAPRDSVVNGKLVKLGSEIKLQIISGKWGSRYLPEACEVKFYDPKEFDIEKFDREDEGENGGDEGNEANEEENNGENNDEDSSENNNEEETSDNEDINITNTQIQKSQYFEKSLLYKFIKAIGY